MRKIKNLRDFAECFDYIQIETEEGLEYSDRDFQDQRYLIDGCRFTTQPEHICSIRRVSELKEIDATTKDFVEILSENEDIEWSAIFIDSKRHEVLFEFWNEEDWLFDSQLIMTFDDCLEDYKTNNLVKRN